jgi:hypothetical protein
LNAQTRADIEALNAEFAWLIDRGDSSKVADLFIEAGRYGRSTGETSVGRDEIRLAYSARIARGPRTSRHVFTNLRLEQIAPGRVRGTLILTLYARDALPPIPAQVLFIADYDDIYCLCEDGRWRYESRLVTRVCTSEAMNVGGGLPLGLR